LMVDAYIHTGSLSPLKYFLRVWQRLVNWNEINAAGI
jgi:hypothetical protein